MTHLTQVEEDENRNVIDVVSMSPTHAHPHHPDHDSELLDEGLDSEDDLEGEASICDQDISNKSESPSSVHNEILAAHSALMSRFQNFPGPPEALEQVQNTLKQMLTHVSAKQMRSTTSSQAQQVRIMIGDEIVGMKKRG